MGDSHEDTKRQGREELSRIVVDCESRLHRELGPGLLESAYEVVLASCWRARTFRSGDRFLFLLKYLVRIFVPSRLRVKQ